MYIEGRNPVFEALNSKTKIKRIYISERSQLDPKIASLIALAKKHRIRLDARPKKTLDKISKTGKHQGIIAISRDTAEKSFSEVLELLEPDDFIIYIRESFNEFNIGSIIRSAEASGAKAIIIPPKMQVGPQVVRSSMGAIQHLLIVKENIFNAIKQAKDHAVKIAGIETNGDNNYFESDLSGQIMFIVGGEDRSLSPEILTQTDFTIKIPMFGKVNSLNMAVASSIVMFEKAIQNMG